MWFCPFGANSFVFGRSERIPRVESCNKANGYSDRQNIDFLTYSQVQVSSSSWFLQLHCRPFHIADHLGLTCKSTRAMRPLPIKTQTFSTSTQRVLRHCASFDPTRYLWYDTEVCQFWLRTPKPPQNHNPNPKKCHPTVKIKINFDLYFVFWLYLSIIV